MMTNALRIPEGTATPEQEFYVKMFQYISYEVQHQILLLTAAHSNNNLDHCRLILLLLKRFPQAISTHAVRVFLDNGRTHVSANLLGSFFLAASPARNIDTKRGDAELQGDAVQ